MSITASVLNGKPFLTVFDDTFKHELGAIDLSPVMLYIIDQAPAAALPFLASQFDVLGYKGWYFCTTDAQKRALIKTAIRLHKKAGTPYAIRHAMEVVGYPNTQVQEHLPGAMHNAQYLHNGDIIYNAPSVFHFRVIIDAQYLGVLTLQNIEDLKQLIYVWKNERSWLYDISFGYTLDDNLQLNDEPAYLTDDDGNPILDENGNYLTEEDPYLTLTINLSLRDDLGNTHDGTYLHDGTIIYSADYGDTLVAT